MDIQQVIDHCLPSHALRNSHESNEHIIRQGSYEKNQDLLSMAIDESHQSKDSNSMLYHPSRR